MAEFAVTSILAAKYVIELTWSQLQQIFAATTCSIEAGQMSRHKLDLFQLHVYVMPCDDIYSFILLLSIMAD